MTKLHDLYDQCGQSPWLDNMRRGWLTGGELATWIDKGIRGITSNPSIFQKAIANSDDYDSQFRELIGAGTSVEDSYWRLVTTDIEDALALLRPTYDSSDGIDGFVSIEVDPGLARDTAATIASARLFHEQIAEPNLFVKIPATIEGVPAIEAMISEGRSINVTLIFSLERHAEVMEAYLGGLEAFDGDLAPVRSVASFFVSRVDTEVDRRLDEIGTPAALDLRGKTAVAQAKLAYAQFRTTFSGARWDALAARGAKVQRPLWASTSTKNPDYPPTLYVDPLIGPDTVNTMPENTIDAFLEHGTVADAAGDGVDEARETLDELAEVGVDMDDVARVLENEGVASFEKSFDELLETLGAKAAVVGAG